MVSSPVFLFSITSRDVSNTSIFVVMESAVDNHEWEITFAKSAGNRTAKAQPVGRNWAAPKQCMIWKSLSDSSVHKRIKILKLIM